MHKIQGENAPPCSPCGRPCIQSYLHGYTCRVVYSLISIAPFIRKLITAVRRNTERETMIFKCLPNKGKERLEETYVIDASVAYSRILDRRQQSFRHNILYRHTNIHQYNTYIHAHIH